MPKQYSLFNYRRNLVVMLILLQLLTVATIILLSRINTDRILIDNAYDTMAKTITQSVDHTQLFLKPAYSAIETLKLLANNNAINFNDVETIEKLFFTELTNNQNFSGIYIANDKSDFIYMLRTNDDDYVKTKLDEAYQTKIISHDSDQRDVFFHWHKSDFSQTRKEKIDSYEYDPKARPWYRLAYDSKRTSWTEPYTFFTSKKRGITVSTPFYDKEKNQTGVIGIDIELDQLSMFLGSIQDDGYIRIIDAKGHLIADSANTNILTVDEIERLIKTQTSKPEKLHGTFQDKQEEYLYVYRSLKSNPSEPDWRIFTYTKTSPFLVEVRSNEKRNIFIALMTLVISILMSVIIARKTSKPVESWVNLASTDNLTQLYNRHFFFNSGNIKYNNYRQAQDHNLALLMIDVDIFKRINDSYGHNLGDDVLKAIANHIKSLVGPDDLLARFGGEEFILLSEIESHLQAMQMAEKIRKSIEGLDITTSAGVINVTVSIGVSVTEKQHGMSFIEFIDIADKALYHSKNNGRNKVSLAKDGKILSNF